jgi:methyl-accepting chemotaxis protein
MAVSNARSAQMHFTEARRALERAIFLREAATAADFAMIDKSMKQFAADMNVVQERVAGAVGFDEGIDKVLPAAREWYRDGMSYLKPPATGITQLPLPQVVIAKGGAVSEMIDVIVENASAYGLDFRSEAEATAVSSKTNLIVLAAVAVFVGLMLAFAMAASFSRPIRQAMASAEEIASGVFTTAISTKRRDELGRLLVSLEKTRRSLAEIVSGIITAANEVSNAAGEISTSTTDLSQRT